MQQSETLPHQTVRENHIHLGYGPTLSLTLRRGELGLQPPPRIDADNKTNERTQITTRERVEIVKEEDKGEWRNRYTNDNNQPISG